MLKKLKAKKIQPAGGHFAIVASNYNERYVGALLRSARAVLNEAKVEGVQIVRVPGAYEIPVVAATLARADSPYFSAIICLGVIFRGETSHAQHIAEAVSNALAQIQVTAAMPVIHGVYLFENEQQARIRCLDKEHNRGAEVARTALDMAQIMKHIHKTNFV